MRTFASLFSGGGLADVGAMSAGLKPLWGVEYDAKIAESYKRNIGEHILVSLAQDVGYTNLEAPYWLHMSPPCTNASVANVSGGETELDIEIAEACIRAIKALQSPVVSLENVYQYRNFESFKKILRVLSEYGYAVKYWHLNSANYGVPQTRKRLFLVASRIKRPQKPPSTHQRRDSTKEQQLSFFPLLPWVGWYEAIEDLIPSLPDDDFAPWQLPLLPAEIRSMLIAQGKYGDKLVTVNDGSSSFTVTANSNQSGIRGVLVRCDNTKQRWGRGYREDNEPSITVTSKGVRAWLINQDSKLGAYQADSPAMTVLSSEKSAFIRAFLADGQTNSNGQSLTVRGGDERFVTASATQDKRPIRAWSGGRVVRMTARAVARFQSVPDSYELTGIKSLDFKVIGNGVPCLMMQRLIEENL